MKIGIDISQLQYKKTGVQNYLQNLVENLIKIDEKNQYVLFFSSLRGSSPNFQIPICNFQFKRFYLPATFLDILWNRLHVIPIEWLIGNVDVFITSDWTEPPVGKAKKATILYDLSVFKFPIEMDKKIVETQRRKLEWVKKESEMIFCISESTKKDAMEILGIEEKRLKIIYPGGIKNEI